MVGTERQHEAITSHDTSMVVSAGAGTGKTFVLVQKYLDLLTTFGEGRYGADRLSVLSILALTFTEKAAAEMKERIRSELEVREGEFWERSRLEFLIAPVQTFHSFCSGVLREFAFEAGLEPAFTVLDERESSRILGQSFADLIHTPTDPQEQDALVILLSLVGTHTLEKMIRSLYAHRTEADLFFSRLRDDGDEVIASWEKVTAAFREDTVRSLAGDPSLQGIIQSLIAFSMMDIPSDDKAFMYLQTVKPFLEVLQNTESADAFLEAAASFTAVSLKGGIAGNWTKDILSELRTTNTALNDRLKKELKLLGSTRFDPASSFTDLTIRFLEALGCTFHRFCTLVDQEKAVAGGIDFTDLIRYTILLFRTQEDRIAPYYAGRYRFILIDEFQDTDPAQFEIIHRIIGTTRADQRSLFIVGDPKQSIYLFRDADVTRFRDARDFITAECGGRNVSLDICFRSSPAVVNFVNLLFSRLFQTAEKPWEFTYDTVRVSDERGEHTGSVTLMLIEKESGIAEPDAVADRIEEIIQDGLEVYEEGPRDEGGKRTFVTHPVTYGDIAILLERRTNLGLFIHALASRNIPYYVYKGTGFYQRQEILDLINLLTVLIRPYDDVSLAGLLRSPYLGFSDRDLFAISQEPGHSFYERLQAFCRKNPQFRETEELLHIWQQRAGRLRLVPLIRSILEESGILAVYGGLTEGEQILSNIEKLLALIQAREEGGRYLLSDLVAELHDALEREEDEGEAMIDDPDLNAVTIMTVHAAKGLEFPVVFVPEMDARPNLAKDPLLLDHTRDLMGIVIPDPDDDFESRMSPVYALLRNELDQRLLAEKRRLLYVALTRAADHLIMSGTVGADLPDGTKPTRLDWIIPTIGIDIHTIEQGHIVLDGMDDELVEIRIFRPEPSGHSVLSDKPPFAIQTDLMDCPGQYTRTVLEASRDDFEPLLVTTIAESIHEPDLAGNRPGGEGGRAFGSAVHEVLQGRDPDMVIVQWAIEDPEQQSRLHTVYNKFWSLPSLAGVQTVFHEKAFTVMIAGVSLTGRMDLLVKREDGSWLVIDYKSDPIPVEDLAAKREYRFQLEIYRQAAEILGMVQVRGALYSVSEHQLIEQDPWSDEEVAMVIRQAAQEMAGS